jgi:DNA-binding transcriptional ArsR family regulator
MKNYSALLDAAFHALSDPTRRAVIQRLSNGPAPVRAIAEPVDIGLPTVLKHLRVLEESGLITTKKSGRTRLCQLEPGRLIEVGSWLSEQNALWQASAERLATYVEAEMAADEE